MTAVARTARPRLAVVADDLTGAADAAAPFASRGAEVSLALSGPPRGDVDVLALVSDSRWREASDAANRVGQLVRQARAWGADALFVKVDSTLRGNVRAEVGAALAAWGGAQAVRGTGLPRSGSLLDYDLRAKSSDPRCCGTTRALRPRRATWSPSSVALRLGRTLSGQCPWRPSLSPSFAGLRNTNPHSRTGSRTWSCPTTGSPRAFSEEMRFHLARRSLIAAMPQAPATGRR